MDFKIESDIKFSEFLFSIVNHYNHTSLDSTVAGLYNVSCKDY